MPHVLVDGGSLAVHAPIISRRRATQHRGLAPDLVTLFRAVLCLGILALHLQPTVTHHWPGHVSLWPSPRWLVEHVRIGFEGFFVLAGYFLARSFRAEPGRPVSVRGFLTRRFARLVVPYWVALFGVGIGGFALTSALRSKAPWFRPEDAWAQALFLQNLVPGHTVTAIHWFMAPLMQFYAWWAVGFVVVRWMGARQGWEDAEKTAERVMVYAAAEVFAGSVVTVAIQGRTAVTLATNAHYLVLGCLSYWQGAGILTRRSLWIAAAAEVTLACSTGETRPIAGLAACLLLAWCGGREFVAGRGWEPLMMVGRCSYSVYLTHAFVGCRAAALYTSCVGTDAANTWPVALAVWLVGIGSSVVFGYGFYRCVEAPCVRWAGRKRHRRTEAEGAWGARPRGAVPEMGWMVRRKLAGLWARFSSPGQKAEGKRQHRHFTYPETSSDLLEASCDGVSLWWKERFPDSQGRLGEPSLPSRTRD